MKKIEVKLTDEELAYIQKIRSWWKAKAREITRALILLASHKWKYNKSIYDFYETTSATVALTRKKWEEWWLEYAIHDRTRSWRPNKYDEKVEAEIVSIACTNPPEWRARWTLELLKERIQKREWCENFSRETVRLFLKKAISNLGKKNVDVLQKLTKNIGIECMTS